MAVVMDMAGQSGAGEEALGSTKTLGAWPEDR